MSQHLAEQTFIHYKYKSLKIYIKLKAKQYFKCELVDLKSLMLVVENANSINFRIIPILEKYRLKMKLITIVLLFLIYHNLTITFLF